MTELCEHRVVNLALTLHGGLHFYGANCVQAKAKDEVDFEDYCKL